MSPQDLWSRRSFMKGAVGQVGILLLSSQFTEALAAIQQKVLGKERSTDLTALSIGEAGDLVRRKVMSPVELTRACLQQIERLNPALNAFITVTPEEALAQARAAEAEVRRGEWRGPLHGIPLGRVPRTLLCEDAAALSRRDQTQSAARLGSEYRGLHSGAS